MLLPTTLTLALALHSTHRAQQATAHPRFLHEFTLPLGAYPLSIVTGADGALWFNTYPYFTNHKAIDLGIGRITIHGKQTFYLIDNGTYDLTLGLDGKIWFTNPFFYQGSYEEPKVGSITTTGKVVQYVIPYASPESITTGADGGIWYVDFGAKHDIVHMDEHGRTVARFHTTPGSRAVKVGRGPGTSMWFDILGRRSAVGSITKTGIAHHLLGGPAYIPGPLTLGPDGRMWISDCTYVAAVAATFDVTLYPLPSQQSCIDGIVSGPDGNLWAADFENSAIVRITPGDGSMVEYPTPTKDMMPDGITVGPDGNIWFTEIQRNTDVSKIGVLKP